MNQDSKIYIAGHSGLVGSALVMELKKDGYYPKNTSLDGIMDEASQINLLGAGRCI